MLQLEKKQDLRPCEGPARPQRVSLERERERGPAAGLCVDKQPQLLGGGRPRPEQQQLGRQAMAWGPLLQLVP